MRLIVFKCLRPDRVATVIMDMVGKHLGDSLTQPHAAVNLVSQAFQQSSASEPIVIITDGTNDIANEMHNFVVQNGFIERFLPIQLSDIR